MRHNTFCSERVNLGIGSAPERSRERVLWVISLLSTLFLVVERPVGAAAPDDAQLCLQPSGETAMAASSRVIESGKFTGRALVSFYISRAAIWRAQHQFNRCLEDLNQAIKLDPTWATPVFDRASIYLQQAQYDRAVEDFDQAIKLDPLQWQAFIGRGFAYEGQGEFDRAIVDLDQAIKLDPSHREACVGRAYAYGRKGQISRAI
jgi:tetratricopeptide (TPR) repeat protein